MVSCNPDLILKIPFANIYARVTETGWPVSGKTVGNAVPSVKNAQKFWRSVACQMFKQGHVFWYAYQDYADTPSFGTFDKNGKAIYDLSKC